MRMIIVAILLLATACPPHPQPNGPTPRPRDMRAPAVATFCAVAVSATTSGVCEGMFTASGLACVRCENAQGCIDSTDAIYCVQGSCTADDACKLQLPDVAQPDGGT